MFLEVSRAAALKLWGAGPGAKRAIDRISLERQRLQIFKGGLTVEDLAPVVEGAEVVRIPAGKVVLAEGDEGDDVYVIRSGSMVVEKDIGGKSILDRKSTRLNSSH